MILMIAGIIAALAGIWLMKSGSSPLTGALTLITGILLSFIGSMKRKKDNAREVDKRKDNSCRSGTGGDP